MHSLVEINIALYLLYMYFNICNLNIKINMFRTKKEHTNVAVTPTTAHTPHEHESPV